MLRGLSEREFKELLLSVGGTAKLRRPLEPVEVGQLCAKAERAGVSRKEVTAALQLKDASMVSKFVRLSRLSPSIQHLVEWGQSSDGAIGFSVAAQMARVDPSDQADLAEMVLKYRLSKTEMISIIQLSQRSGELLADCVTRVVNRRAQVSVRHVVLGAVSDTALQTALERLDQTERDRLLRGALVVLYPSLASVTAKLGSKRFTVTGGKVVSESISRDKDFETRVTEQVRLQLEGGER